MGMIITGMGLSTGELPAEQEIAMLVVRKILPELRSTLATLNGMQQTWHLNGMPELIAAAAKSGELLATTVPRTGCGGTGADGDAGNGCRCRLGIGATPAQVLLKRYVGRGCIEPEKKPEGHRE